MIHSTPRGSLWRRWDLHIHTPETKLSDAFKLKGENVWDKYLDTLDASPVKVFGITDYFCCKNYFLLLEKYEARFPEGEKVFFPNIEFRLSEIISTENTSPEIHVIFDNDPKYCPQKKIETFLTHLTTHSIDQDSVEITCSQLTTETEFMSATVTLADIKKALDKTFGASKPYIIIFPAKNGGMRSTDSKSPRKVEISANLAQASHGFFGGSDSVDFCLERVHQKTGEPDPKPVFSCSDAHSFDELERLSGDVTNFEPTWIKANLTFEGLKQTIFEPEARVFIGHKPSVLTRKKEQSTKFIDSLKIENVAGYKSENGHWFKDVNIPFNPELTAIIGNKGSGKSALADILGLLGDSRTEGSFSFLTSSSKNLKFRQRGFAENFNATLTWVDSSQAHKNLNDTVDITQPEKVKYLPQNYFETLTNEIKVKEFQNEIEEVVFSHVEETDRLNQTNFTDLQNFKTQESRDKISALKTSLRELNHRLDELKKRSNPIHKETLEKELLKKEDELKALNKSTPKEEEKPSGETPEQKATSKKIEALSTLNLELDTQKRELTSTLATKKEWYEKIRRINSKLVDLQSRFDEDKLIIEELCKDLGLNASDVLHLKIDKTSLQTLAENLKSEIADISKDNELHFLTDSVFSDAKEYNSLPDVNTVLEALEKRKKLLKDQLSAPSKRYQNYLTKLAELEKQKFEVLGDETSPNSNTIRYIQHQIKYIKNELAAEITGVENSRKAIAEQIFDAKKQVLSFYRELKESVEAKLSIFKEDNFSVSIEAAFVLSGNFKDDFFEFVGKSAKGPFQGDGENALRKYLSEVDWNSFESVYDFAVKIISNMEKTDFSKQVRQNKSPRELCDFLFSLDFIKTNYELRLGNKNLNELSPGEKGLLLLVFYLHLDKENTPLIIDQAEDNLDNDSIFSVLAKCIRAAKKNRQVILVTHNPNLAVGADAEQIIYVKLEKHLGYKFTYECGAIEEPGTNANIVKVLEGSKPAFVQRRLKYQI